MAIFFQMMAKHTQFAKIAQSEIDELTKQERLPTIDDRESLPTIDCIMREVFRYVFSCFQLRVISEIRLPII